MIEELAIQISIKRSLQKGIGGSKRGNRDSVGRKRSTHKETFGVLIVPTASKTQN